MPYIEHSQRADLFYTLPHGLSVGQINFIFSDLADQYVGPYPDYERLNGIVGVLECVKQELYRRVVVPFEDKKLDANGDIYMERE